MERSILSRVRQLYRFSHTGRVPVRPLLAMFRVLSFWKEVGSAHLVGMPPVILQNRQIGQQNGQVRPDVLHLGRGSTGATHKLSWP